jgi:hypothetical protein
MENYIKSKLKLVIPGALNQIYTNIDPRFTNYNELLKFILKNLGLDKAITSSIKKDLKILIDSDSDSTNIHDFFLQKYKINFEDMFNYNSKTILKNFETLYIKILEEINLVGHEIILLHDSIVNLFLDKLILKSFKIDNFFSFSINNNNFEDQVKNYPKNYLFSDHDLERLKIRAEGGSWTQYLTYLIFSSLYHCNSHNEPTKLILKNLEIIKKQGNFFNFSNHKFYNLRNYFETIYEVNSESFLNTQDTKLFEEKLKSLNLIKVLVFYKVRVSKNQFKRSDGYTSDKKVFFISHIGGLWDSLLEHTNDINLSENKLFDVIFFRISELSDYKNFSKFRKSIDDFIKTNPNILILNSIQNLPEISNRKKMIKFIGKFCESDEVLKICEKFNTNIQFPKSISLKYRDIKDLDSLHSFLKSHNFRLPMILKFIGPRRDYDHLIVVVVTLEGLQNFLHFMNEFNNGDDSKVTVVFQTFVNHGGLVCKLYYLNKKSYIYFRISLPDINDDIINSKEYKQGFYSFKTEDMSGEAFKTLWKHGINEKIIDSYNLEFLGEVAIKYETFSLMSLYGIDFLYDPIHNIYNLIDVNFYPSYSELDSQLNGLVLKLISDYYSRFKEKGTIY